MAPLAAPAVASEDSEIWTTASATVKLALPPRTLAARFSSSANSVDDQRAGLCPLPLLGFRFAWFTPIASGRKIRASPML